MSIEGGAAFCNFLLADEINRASPKAQSSLLEVMEEHQISIDGNTYALPNPFMTLATQNPVENLRNISPSRGTDGQVYYENKHGYPSPKEKFPFLTKMNMITL